MPTRRLIVLAESLQQPAPFHRQAHCSHFLVISLKTLAKFLPRFCSQFHASFAQ
jgi:hypothetical protein